ncbi:MAG: hypothetical protein H6739_41335 [Alphaproteobacteria bacterium]|nr:hypothetical protein [Alphaproteobacteria bacterium]
MHPPHDELILHRGELSVHRCGCGVVHVELGCVTLRLEEDAFAAMVSHLSEAAGLLAARRWMEDPAEAVRAFGLGGRAPEG